MGIPPGSRIDVTPADPPSKVFSVDDANRVLPAIEAIFGDMDHRAVRQREVTDLVQDLEMYWADRVGDPGCPDHDRYRSLLWERDDLQKSLGEDIQRIQSLGAVLKDYTSGLVDFHGVENGELVFLCWQRGEPEVRFFHSLEGGFAGRRPLAAVRPK